MLFVVVLASPAPSAIPVQSAISAAQVASGFADTVAFSGLTNPTNLRFSPDGRVFIAEKSGVILEYDSLADTTPTVFADLSSEVDNYWDRGLLGLALDPNFPTTPYVYALYSLDASIGGTTPVWNDACPTPPGPTTDGCVIGARLVRLTASGNVMTPGSEKTLLEGWCQQFPSHSIGDLQFGPDGALYVSGGDGAAFDYADYGQSGGSLTGTPTPKNPCGDPPGGVGGTMTSPTAEGGSLRSQSLRRPAGQPVLLNGAILRVDPATGLALPTNPNAGAADLNARRIIAAGFRNPFRFTFRPGTNEVWVGDVGSSLWEEINRITNPTSAVTNFGWPCYEGNAAMPSFQALGLNMCTSLYNSPGVVTNPYFTYSHTATLTPNEACPTGGASITGVSFYNGTGYPAAYNGALFFADYTRSCIWAMLPGGNGLPNPANIQLIESGAASPVDLEAGPNGDIYYADLNGGTIRRISSTGTAPSAVATANPTGGPVPLTVAFDASGSSGPVGHALAYSWDLNGDGVFGDATTVNPSHVYTTAGSIDVRVRVTDTVTGLNSTSAPVRITPGNSPPSPTISSPASTLTWAVGDTISFSGSATDPEQGALPATALRWDEILHHCASDGVTCHTHQIQTFTGVSTGSFAAPDHEYPSWLELRLTATDSAGATGVASIRLDPKTVSLTLNSSPTGLQLGVNSTVATTPFSITVIQGSTTALSAPEPQPLGGTSYRFRAWSDGGAQSHSVVANSAGSYTATFAPDLAQGHPATASSSESVALGPGMAVDGNSTTRWGSNYSDNQWWQVDLGSAKTIDTVALNWETAYGSSYKIQVSTDGITFTDAATVADSAPGWKVTSFAPVSARYVRVQGITRATVWGYSFWDAQVFGPVSGGSPPANTALPVVSGTATQGQTLTTSNGAWTNNPTSFSYQWKRCDTGGANCAAIGGATSASYLLAAADVGSRIVAAVTATNASGSATATSAATAVVVSSGSPPANTALPVVSGTPTQGQTLSTSTGTWTNSPTSFSYQWKRCDTNGANCAAISGATSATYLLGAADVGSRIVAAVTATNASGSATATSAATAVIASNGSNAPGNTTPPAVTGLAGQGQTLSTGTGSWTNNPTSFSYQWKRCDTGGANCAAISGATTASYLLTATDVNSTIIAAVTATNASGSTTANSTATAVVKADAALGMIATASSSESVALAPGLAVDGNPTTRWGSNYSDNEWWQVDLGSAKTIDTVALNWETAYGSSYKIQVSTDGTTFTDAATVADSAPGWKITAFTAVSARYLRMQGITRATVWGYSFWDAEVFGPVSGGSPPANTVLPVVSGTPTQGQTLSTSTGTWTNSPTSFGYQWKRCDTNGANCAAISGATSASYLLAAADVGSRIVAAVTASNASGSATATSAATAVVVSSGSPPANTALPVVSGTPTQGQTLTTSTGTWTNNPTSFGYQWKRCDTNGANCAAISGATSATYLLAAADVGSRIVAAVTATNASGSATANSAATAVVASNGSNAPGNITPPAVSGLAGQGQTLSTGTGSWTNSPTSFSYQWKRCDTGGANCAAISGATSATYLLTATDVNSTIIAAVTASNASGSTTANSTATAVVRADAALGKTATASSSESVALAPGMAVDGNSSTRWGSNYTDNEWWQVDLGSLKTIDTIALNWETAYGSSYKIQVSSDGITFTDAATVSNSSAGWKITSFAPTSARYVRVQGITRATVWGYSFWDAQVF